MPGAIRTASGAWLLRPSLKVFPFCFSWLCRSRHISVFKRGPVPPKGGNPCVQGSVTGMWRVTSRRCTSCTHQEQCHPPTAPGLPSCPWGTHSSSAKQWAAVKIHRALMMVPPQMCFPWLWMLTCHGNSPGLTCVPVPILLPVFWKDS